MMPIVNGKIDIFPTWLYAETLTEKKIKQIVTPKQYTFFESCRKKLGSIWYICSRIIELDREYLNEGQELLKMPKAQIRQIVYIKPINEYEYHYDAYWLTTEFEHLLLQAKACADVFAKAIGVAFRKSPPNNILKLMNMLQEVKDSDNKDKARKILSEIDRNKRYFCGVILPPEQLDKKLKSLRDLAGHRERLNVWFKIRLPGSQYKSGVYGGFVDMRGILLQKFTVVNISQNLWFGLKRMIENSFMVIAERKRKVRSRFLF